MTTGITRRDFMNGMAIAVAGVAGADLSFATDDLPEAEYPPGRTGLRGSHAGSFEAAHRLRDGAPFDLSQAGAAAEHYDLVVVGAGMSGLSAAHFYLKRRPHARVLILDTNDDFGGHAKRNEFLLDGTTLIGYGGTQSIDSPGRWSKAARSVLNDLGIDLTRFQKAFDQDFYARWGLSHSTFFKREKFGVDKLVRRPFGSWQDADEKPTDDAALHAYLEAFPVSEAARAQLFEMMGTGRDVLAGKSRAQRLAILEHTSYRDFLERYWHADPAVLDFLQTRTHDLWAVGIDAVPASLVSGMPGMQAQRRFLPTEVEEPYIYHFPDGNASLARMLVRRLLPGIAAGSGMDDIVLARFDYEQLDRPEHAVRIRLNSTVVDVRNAAHGVELCYVSGGRVERIAARDCVLACYHAMIPYLASETPPGQRAALHENVRAPLVYCNVIVRNWLPWQRLGVAYIDNPGGTYAASLDFPVSLGGYRFTGDPSQPACIHLLHTPTQPNQGLSMREQYRTGRARLYTMTFAQFESEIRDELGRMLGGAGFDFERDVAAITVNRWPHGYAYTPTTLFDEPARQTLRAVRARQRIGRIAIANSDSGWDAYTNVAFDQAHRAVSELLG